MEDECALSPYLFVSIHKKPNQVLKVKGQNTEDIDHNQIGCNQTPAYQRIFLRFSFHKTK